MDKKERRLIMRMITSMRTEGKKDDIIAAKLNMEGIKTGHGHPWTDKRVYNFALSNKKLSRTRVQRNRKRVPSSVVDSRIIKKIMSLGLSDRLMVRVLKEGMASPTA